MKQKGISLIVLIITIVVIIILATAIIVNLAQTNIIANANEAVVKQDFKTMQDELTLYVANRYADTLGKFDVSSLNANKTTSPSVYEILTSLEKSKYKEYVVIENGKIAILETMPEPEKTWAMEALSLAETSDNVPTEPEVPSTPVVAVGEVVTDLNATITGKQFAYNNPVIPVGFKAKETTEASWADENDDGIVDGWNNGLVIADEDENEFVWVPVDGTDVTYTKRFAEYPKNSDITSVSDDTEALPKVNGTTISENEQITTYQGFYIGRYEAGIQENQTSPSDTTGIPVTKCKVTAWTDISYPNANTNALSFCNTDNVKSGLVTGTQWDTIMKWIENADISVTDSGLWGNHKNSVSPANVTGYGSKQVTGFSEYWKAKNIYDLAGNNFEWSGEKFLSNNITRGGGFTIPTPHIPAAGRNYNEQSYTYYDLAFRIVLYIM